HIQYPMRYAAAHGFAEIQTWPLEASGKDLSIIKNQTDGPVSLFVHGSREDFMGIWNPHSNTGTAHFARYNELPAKKIWSWGVDADGLDWRDALSDDNSAYAEVQGGLFRNQETYSFLQPRQHIGFSEYWMPVREIGGISRANLAGAVNLERKNDSLLISLNVNQKFFGATLRLLDGNKELFSERRELQPEKTWTKAMRLPDSNRKYTFELKNRDGAVVLKQTENEYAWMDDSQIKLGPQANYVIPPEKFRTEDDWLQTGDTQELNGDKLAAMATYKKALQRFPTSFALHKASGRILCSLQRFEEARDLLAAAQARNTTDGELSYYLGMALEGVGKDSDALDAYEAAARMPQYRASAALRIAQWNARQGNFREAENFVAVSLAAAPDDLRALEMQVALDGALGDAQAEKKQAELLLRRFPLSAFLREEAGVPDLAHLAADPSRVLNIAAQYARLGLFAKAVNVLARDYPGVPSDQHEPGVRPPQENPLVVYLLGYCHEKLGESGASDYARASKLSTLYVFPSTSEERAALEAALRFNDKDVTAHSLLGTWFFARAKSADALREWQAASELHARIPALDASLGWALLHEKRDTASALTAFENGIATDPRNELNYSGATATMAILGKSAAQRVKVLERFPDLTTMPVPLVYELALNRAEAGDFSGAISLFQNRFFGREEGGLNVRQVWIEVRLMEMLALAKSGRCGEALAEAKTIGQPMEGLPFTQNGLEPFLNSPRTDYLLAQAYDSCGEKTESLTRFKKVAADTELSNLSLAADSAKRLDSYDRNKWTELLESGLAKAEEQSSRGNSKAWWTYLAASLRMSLGQNELGQTALRDVFLLPDTRMAHHLARLALVGNLNLP
ncbi:MAG: DUF5107 domain-containing protein, partial [Acidobacteria bacterium]|nr:DUF5107 domain-containing protein [Acidobacteriota bacterium]